MELLFFCPRWGSSDLSWDAFAAKAKQAGYDGIETDIPAVPEERKQLLAAIEKYSLSFIAQHWETVVPDFQQHKQAYKKQIQYLAEANPLFVNSQTGKDYYSFEQNSELIAIADEIAVASGIPVYHETHRGKFSYAAHVMHAYLQKIQGLRITLDISHWCAVAETLLHDQPGAVQAAIAKTMHIHARIGHSQSAQVNDPRAPEWEEARQFHLQCWDAVVNKHMAAGSRMLGITTEFGPDPYMPQQPFTRVPLANQWEVNEYMMDLLKSRYKKIITETT